MSRRHCRSHLSAFEDQHTGAAVAMPPVNSVATSLKSALHVLLARITFDAWFLFASLPSRARVHSCFGLGVTLCTRNDGWITC